MIAAAPLSALTVVELEAAIAEYDAGGRDDLLDAALSERADRGLDPDFALTPAAMFELEELWPRGGPSAWRGARSAAIAGRATHFLLSLVAICAFVAGVTLLAPLAAR
jgi:hypothetical protein